MFTLTSTEQTFPVKAMFVVPKKNFRKAHDRNKLKRRMKEAYRLSKHNLYAFENLKDKKLLMSFIYVGKNKDNFQSINKAILSLQKKIEKVTFESA